jgi:hypothetical protein
LFGIFTVGDKVGLSVGFKFVGSEEIDGSDESFVTNNSVFEGEEACDSSIH